MKDGEQGPVKDDGAVRAESPLGAEKSSLHSMMIYDAAMSEEDGIHKTQSKKSRGSLLKHQIVMVTLIVVALVGLLTLISLTIWNSGSSMQNKQQQNSSSNSKTSWPELVGEPGLEAQKTILAENSDITMAPLVGLDSAVHMDYRPDRVWIWVNYDNDQTVARTPMIG